MNLDILSQEDLHTLRSTIEASQNIVICCHKSPDGDAIGSSLAWANYLKSKGKAATVTIPDACPDFLQWLPEFAQTVIRFDKHPDEVKALFDHADLIMCLDFNVSSRLEDMQSVFDNATATKILVDHHIGPDIPEARLVISHEEMSSTCELTFRILWQLGEFEAVSKQCAVDIYCGMMTDTGGFTYNSSRPEIFLIISHLLEKGVDKDDIYNRVNHNYSSWCIRMRGNMMMQKLNVYEDLHASYFTLTREEMQRFHYIKGDAEGLVNEPLKIKGLKLSIYLREDTVRDNLIFVSLRSSCGFHCKQVAEKFFNGGGHADAAGGKLHCSMDEAKEIAKNAIKYFAEELKK